MEAYVLAAKEPEIHHDRPRLFEISPRRLRRSLLQAVRLRSQAVHRNPCAGLQLGKKGFKANLDIGFGAGVQVTWEFVK